eukprot:TRINITY_DN8033_c0_g1_i2.p1 TRINITY_DN8033_c0_g1~~TRINITY_DN8033_c0_g1_i2.p1  ORF type:complete len:218 (+),score=41.15 TRINITY_DN8033_c0_g1_i2:122-775(+)
MGRTMSTQMWIAVTITAMGVALSGVGTIDFTSGLNTVQLLGILVTMLTSITYAVNYVVGEIIISSPNPPPAQRIQVLSGLTSFFIVSIYFVTYTIPNWNEWVVKRVNDVGGNWIVIVITYFALMMSAFFHSWSYYKLLQHTGSVSTAILQSLRAISVFSLSSVLFCDIHKEQCINTAKSLSTIVVVLGVLYFTYLKNVKNKKPKTLRISNVKLLQVV